MPLPIKQYKHMFKDVKFLATTAQPSYREVSRWIDLLEDPTGGTIKVWNGAEWKKILRTAYGSSVGVQLDSSNDYHLSSTEYSNNMVRYVHTNKGFVSGYNKNYYGYVRAWLRIKPDGTITSRTTIS